MNDSQKSDLSLIEEVDLSDELSDLFQAADKLEVKRVNSSKSFVHLNDTGQLLVKPMH